MATFKIRLIDYLYQKVSPIRCPPSQSLSWCTMPPLTPVTLIIDPLRLFWHPTLQFTPFLAPCSVHLSFLFSVSNLYFCVVFMTSMGNHTFLIRRTAQFKPQNLPGSTNLARAAGCNKINIDHMQFAGHLLSFRTYIIKWIHIVFAPPMPTLITYCYITRGRWQGKCSSGG